MNTPQLRAEAERVLRGQQEALAKLNVPDISASDRARFYGYEIMLEHVLRKGGPKTDRTEVGTTGVHGYQERFDLDNGFPLITTKKIYTKAVIHELLWLLKGDTNIQYLCKNGVRIWDDWPYEKYKGSPEFAGEDIKAFAKKIAGDDDFAKKWGDLGPVYGKQWRKWETTKSSIDQVKNLIVQLKKQVETGIMSRRAIVTAWNPTDVPAMALPPCHAFFQLHTMLMSLEERRDHWKKIQSGEGAFDRNMTDEALDEVNAPAFKLDLQLYQRSCDIFLGVPFNIASYSLLLMMIAQVVAMKAGTFIHDYGDLHIYSNHFDQAVLQLSRKPFPYPTMKIKNRGQDIDEFEYEDFELLNYQCHEGINAEVAV